MARRYSGDVEKKDGLIQVNKLRAILLMEADFNFANKLFVGYRMMRQLASTGSAPKEVYGGIKSKDARAVGLLRRLIPDISRQMRLPLAIASVDAQSCYDRIAHPVASLACQRLGVPAPIMVAMFATIPAMRFYLRTACGDSETFYGGGRYPNRRTNSSRGLPRKRGGTGNLDCHQLMPARLPAPILLPHAYPLMHFPAIV